MSGRRPPQPPTTDDQQGDGSRPGEPITRRGIAALRGRQRRRDRDLIAELIVEEFGYRLAPDAVLGRLFGRAA